MLVGGEGPGVRGKQRMSKRPRDREATAFARHQRATANEFARNVWQIVRNRRCRGEKFRREYPIGPYTVDFCCVALKLVIEVDGEHHFQEEGKRHDPQHDSYCLASLLSTLYLWVRLGSWKGRPD